MFEKFSEGGLKVLNDARAEAEKRGHECVEPEHFLFVLLNDEKTIQILKEMRLSPERIRKDIESSLTTGKHILKYGDIPFSSQAQKILELATGEAKIQGRENSVSSEHILLGIIREKIAGKGSESEKKCCKTLR